MQTRTRIAGTALATLTLAGLTVSCGDDEPRTYTIDGNDYVFENVPAKIAAGNRLALNNSSAKELHEMVVFRLPDDVDTPLAELLTGAPDEMEATLGAPVTVILRPPGAPEPIMAVGDGQLDAPGRYALLCFIPVGADPEEYLTAVEAAAGEAPAEVAGGAPHFTAGMFAELLVE